MSANEIWPELFVILVAIDNMDTIQIAKPKKADNSLNLHDLCIKKGGIISSSSNF